jgi:hypothetical protein
MKFAPIAVSEAGMPYLRFPRREGIIALHGVWVDIVITEEIVSISETDARR